ncbi:hypothetical protein PH197_00315 [Leuconostoc lactis]|uniref:hypothetical protein n=1 Tax=Leuconostoc lactis TaxID=1246 RepID=UPI00272D8912|nr:hypothetical protein [Leuconostoc lactis]WKY79316.1 hypothetical protein PH197_00315 [Leuconostoc lactis]
MKNIERRNMLKFKGNKTSTKNAINESVSEADDVSRQVEILESQFLKYSRLIAQLDEFHIKMLSKGSTASYIVIGVLVVAGVMLDLFLFFNSDKNNTPVLVSLFSIVFTVTLGGIYKILDNRSNQSKTIFDTKKVYLDKLIEIDSKIQVLNLENNISTNYADTVRQQRINDLIEKITK